MSDGPPPVLHVQDDRTPVLARFTTTQDPYLADADVVLLSSLLVRRRPDLRLAFVADSFLSTPLTTTR